MDAPVYINTLFAQGLGNTTVFCGDGINDLAALSAADVGMSVGATDAFIAAAISTPQGSVAGRSWTNMAWHCRVVFSLRLIIIDKCDHACMQRVGKSVCIALRFGKPWPPWIVSYSDYVPVNPTLQYLCSYKA
jgi:hypothetical protein